jgi:F-type H+-transporting ATPase subunit b
MTLLRGFTFPLALCVALLLAGAPVYAHAATQGKAAAKETAVKGKHVAATEAAPAEHAEEAGGHGGSDAGLPQLDPKHFPGQAFWLVIAFGFTFFLMRYVALPKVEGVLSARASRIDSALADAKAHNEEAKRLAAELELRMADARSRAQDRVKDATADQSAILTGALSEQQKRLDEQMKTAQQRLEKQKKEALAALDEEAAAMVGSIVKHIAGVTPTPDQAAKAWRAVKEG